MDRLPPRPVLDWKTIAARARAFAEKFHLSSRPFPLDIEKVAEFDLEIEIRVVSGLLEEIDSPAQIAVGDTGPVITVDADQWRQQTSFYRYSVAHEIGHYILHREWLEKVWRLIDSIHSWKSLIRSRSEDDYTWMEAQAEEFASFLLAPEEAFEPFISEQISRLSEVKAPLCSEDVLPYLANPVEVRFGMSNAAAQARIRKSAQWKTLSDELNGRNSTH